MLLPISFFKAKVLRWSVVLEMVLSTEATCSLFLPYPKSPFHFPVQISGSVLFLYFESPLEKKKRELAILSGQFLVERRKCNCVFYWPTTKCPCLVFLVFKD